MTQISIPNLASLFVYLRRYLMVFCFSGLMLSLSAEALEVDSSFGQLGGATCDNGGWEDHARFVVTDSFGRVVVGVTSENPIIAMRSVQRVILLCRFNSNGTPDTSFGSGGKIVLRLLKCYLTEIRGLQVDSQNRILVGYQLDWRFQQSKVTYEWGILRLNSNGERDLKFGTSGSIPKRYGLLGMIMDSADRIIAMSRATNVYNSSGGASLQRYSVNGQLDSSYGVGGEGLIPFTQTNLEAQYNSSTHYSIAKVLPDGGVLLQGINIKFQVNFGPVNCSGIFVRLTPEGMPYFQFGHNGSASFPFTNFTPGMDSMYIDGADMDSLGRAYGFWRLSTLVGGNETFKSNVVSRLTPEGNVDSFFGDSATPAIHYERFGGVGADFHIAILVNDKPMGFGFIGPNIYSGLQVIYGGVRATLAVLQLNPDGTPDGSFGQNGVFNTQVSTVVAGLPYDTSTLNLGLIPDLNDGVLLLGGRRIAGLDPLVVRLK